MYKRIKLGYKSPCDPYSDNYNRALINARPQSTIVNNIISKYGIDKLKYLPKPNRSYRDYKTESNENNRTIENLPELHNKQYKYDMKKLLTNNQNHLNNTMQPTAPTQYYGAKYGTNPSPVNQ